MDAPLLPPRKPGDHGLASREAKPHVDSEGLLAGRYRDTSDTLKSHPERFWGHCQPVQCTEMQLTDVQRAAALPNLTGKDLTPAPGLVRMAGDRTGTLVPDCEYCDVFKGPHPR